MQEEEEEQEEDDAEEAGDEQGEGQASGTFSAFRSTGGFKLDDRRREKMREKRRSADEGDEADGRRKLTGDAGSAPPLTTATGFAMSCCSWRLLMLVRLRNLLRIDWAVSSARNVVARLQIQIAI